MTVGSNPGMLANLILLVILVGGFYFLWKRYQKTKAHSPTTSSIVGDSTLDGKSVVIILNVFAIISLIASILSLVALISSSSGETVVFVILFVSGLFSYASLKALTIIILNLVRIRKNTEK